ncbi:hypothetical protein IWX90DRAFT_147904 [Phyllosticta citrichinensis]|uniref:Uncharacterized protein n=1 Tax=Phyllosticta citrichinensis TaxID=1130410 RepID=A0ABR1XZ98_9PEZI
MAIWMQGRRAVALSRAAWPGMEAQGKKGQTKKEAAEADRDRDREKFCLYTDARTTEKDWNGKERQGRRELRSSVVRLVALLISEQTRFIDLHRRKNSVAEVVQLINYLTAISAYCRQSTTFSYSVFLMWRVLSVHAQETPGARTGRSIINWTGVCLM